MNRTSALLEAIIAQASVSLESFRTIENIEKVRRQELPTFSAWSRMVSSELKIGPLLAEDHRGDHPHARRRTVDPIPQRRKDQRIVLARRAGRAGSIRFPTTSASPAPCSPLGKRSTFPTPTPICASTRLRHADGLLHPLDPVRADHQQDGKMIGVTQAAEQERRAVHARTSAPQGVHRAARHQPRERQAVRRRAEDQELQREHAREHVERRHHAERATNDRHLQQRRRPHLKAALGDPGQSARRNFSPTPMPGSSSRIARSVVGRSDRRRDGRWIASATAVSVNLTVLPLTSGEASSSARS